MEISIDNQSYYSHRHREQVSYDVCLEVRREIIGTVLCCIVLIYIQPVLL